jgi:hypothetical protein
MKQITKVSIALKPNVYNTFRALNNTVSFTLGEYVDNAVQSFLNNKEALLTIDPHYKLEVKIIIDWTEKNITISDNAAGINTENYERAFEPAHIPLDATGLNEFGMGMKTASVWLADKWSVRTKALGETVERFMEFDLNKVTSEGHENLSVIETPKHTNEHYTVIKLTNLSKHAPSTNQVDKIRRHLSSIYRKYLRSDDVSIFVNGEKLSAPNFEILYAPFYKTPNTESVLWRKDIDFQLGQYKAKGFIAILKNIQKGANGLVLLRRGRVIMGGTDERYFPPVIFGQVGSFRYRRLFGEIELEGFDVSFNKNGFRDEEDLYAFMEALREELRSPNFNLLAQADNLRQRHTKESSAKIAKDITKKLKKETNPKQLTRQVEEVERNFQNQSYINKTENIIQNSQAIDSHTESFIFNGINYILRMDLVTETNTDTLYSVKQEDTDNYDSTDAKRIVCKINLQHPFFTRFDYFQKANDYQPLIAIFKALTLAEIMGPSYGVNEPATLRIIFNQHINN